LLRNCAAIIVVAELPTLLRMPRHVTLAGMEFSYKISEADYLAAWKLLERKTSHPRDLRSIAIWVAVNICLLIAWFVVSHRPIPVSELESPSSHASSGPLLTSILVVIGLVTLFRILYRVKNRSTILRKMYWKNPSMQGEFTVDITADGVRTQNTAGTSSTSRWEVYEFWSEEKDLILLTLRNETFSILNLGALSTRERDELRAIVAAALPLK